MFNLGKIPTRKIVDIYISDTFARFLDGKFSVHGPKTMLGPAYAKYSMNGNLWIDYTGEV